MTNLMRFLFENAGALVIFITLESWQFLTKAPLNFRTALTIVGLYLVLSLLDALRRIHDHRPTAAAGAEKVNKPIFVDNPEVVLALTKLTGYEYARRFTPYLGKWVTISGRYEGIAESLQRDSIHLSLLMDDGQRLNLRFSMDRGEQLLGFQAGQRITVAGQIPMFRASFIAENCELVRAEPVRRTNRSPLASVC